MSHILTALGEEYTFTNNVDGATLDVGLYNDSTDGISDGDDLAAISTEPGSNTNNYSRQSDTYTVENPTGSDVVANNDNQLSFDFSDQSTSETVDSYFVEVNFQSTVVNSETSGNDHLLFTGALSQDRDIGSIDTLNISAGGAELQLE